MSYFKYILLFISFTSYSLLSPLSIDESLHFLTNNSPLGINIYLGTPPQPHTITIDISESYSWIHKDIFDSSQSSTFISSSKESTAFQTTHFTPQGIESTDSLRIANTVLDNFTFYVVDTIKGQPHFLSTLSLGRNSDLINNLFNNNKITYQSFSLELIDIETQGILHIGNDINELVPNTTQQHQCKLINSKDDITKHKWGCQLTHIYLGNIETNANDKVSSISKYSLYTLKDNKESYGFFETIYTKIFVPKDFIEYLDKYYFINEQSNICVKQELNNKGDIIYKCDQSKIGSLTMNVNFIFDGKLSLYLQPQDLITCTSPQNCEFVIAHHSDINYYAFGTPFLKLFHTYFDYKKDYLTFYSNSNFINVSTTKKSNFLTYVIVVFIILIILFILSRWYLGRRRLTKKILEDKIYAEF
jgi:hypothetical protein